MLAKPVELVDPVLLAAAPVAELVVEDVSLLANPALVDEVLLVADGVVALVELVPACAFWLVVSLLATAEDGVVLDVVLELLLARPAAELLFAAVSAFVEEEDVLEPAALLL